MQPVRTPGVSPRARRLALLAAVALVGVGLVAGAAPAAAQESCPVTEGDWIAEVAADDAATMTVAAPSKMLIVETCVEVAGGVVRASYSPGEPRVTLTSTVPDDAGSLVPISRVSYRLEMAPTTPGVCPPDLSLCPPAVPDPTVPDPTLPDPTVPSTPTTPAPVTPTAEPTAAGAAPAATASATGARRPAPQAAAPAPATAPDAAPIAVASSVVTPSAAHRTATFTAAAPVTRDVSLAEAHASARATATARSARAAGGAGVWGVVAVTLLAAGAARALVTRRRLVAARVGAAG